MRFDLGIPLTRYRKLTACGLISGQDHADVVAALLLRARQVPGQVQARLGDSLYLIGPPDAAVIKTGRSGTPEKRLRGLARGSPVRLVIHHVEPGLGIAETMVHKMLDDRRLHGEWFDFTDADPVRTVRDTLRTVPDLGWLWAVPRAYQARQDHPAEIQRLASRPGNGTAGGPVALPLWPYLGLRRRAAGSDWATWRATASGPGRAYRSRDRTEACRDRESSIGVLVPSSASCVSSECRSWWRVQPCRLLSSSRVLPEFARGRVASSKFSSARRYDSLARSVTGHRSSLATGRAGRRAVRKTGPSRRPARRRGSSRAVPVCQWTQSVFPPLEMTRPRLLRRSRSGTSRGRGHISTRFLAKP